MSNGISIKGIVDAGLVVHHFDHEYLDNNPEIPETDTTLSEVGQAAESASVGLLSSAIDARIQGIKNGRVLLPTVFIYGSHTNQSGGEAISQSTYRITNKTKVKFSEEVTFTIADGFRVRRYWFNDSGFVNFDGTWKTETFTLSPSYSYYINIARATDDTSEVADISFFASQVYMPFTDTSLSKSGMPADAGTVRERSILRRGEASASDHNNLLSDIFMPGAYLVSPIAFDDTPIKSTANGFLFVFNVNANFAAQILYGISAGNKQVYWRSIKANGDEVSPWTTFDSLPVRNVLAIGDSICNGERNNNRGFVGGLGIPYINAGVSGACLSTVRDSTTHWIENQLTSQTRDFDAILMEGGINDYIYSAPLGTMSDRPARRDATDTTPYDSLDTGTVIGALEHLFANCIYKYPDADRSFVITHKTRNYPWVAHFTGGYTQKQLHDAIVDVCELYNVRVIDVYKDSPINTYFKEYYSPTEWSNDNSVGDTEWVDNDQVHPLDYGYLHGYIPLIKDALMSASHK